MRAIAGAFPKGRAPRRAGYAVLIYTFVLFGLVIGGIMLAPNLVLKFIAKKRDVEEQRMERIGRALQQSVQRGLHIPSHTDWSSYLLTYADMDQTELEQTDPSFADANLTRVFLIDPNLGSTILPYTQTPAGLTGSQTNLIRTAARVMIVSNTKRNLSLPVSSGIPASSNIFNNIWDWVFDPVTKAPPSGWPASWDQSGQFLHVQRINLANLFHRIACSNLRYGFSTNTMTNAVSTETAFQFLRGTPLALADTGGALKRLHVVNRDIGFDFGGSGSILEQNLIGGNKAAVKVAQKGAQSFYHGTAGDPSYTISKIVLHFSREPELPDANLNVNIGTARYSGALPGSSVSIPPAAITDATSGATFMTYEINYGTPIGPLTAGTTYWINLECEGPNGKSIYVELSSFSTYPNGTYYKAASDDGKDAWFQLWGQ